MKATVLRVAMVCAALALAGCEQTAEPDARGSKPAKGIDRSHAGTPLPDIALRDSGDDPASLADSGKGPLLVNLWATWCAPCVKELPTLNALARRPGAPRVAVVSQDMGPRASVEAFLDLHRIADAESWHDPQMALSGALGANLLPTTALYDAQGRELWRYVGDMDWTGAEAARLLAEARAGG